VKTISTINDQQPAVLLAAVSEAAKAFGACEKTARRGVGGAEVSPPGLCDRR